MSYKSRRESNGRGSVLQNVASGSSVPAARYLRRSRPETVMRRVPRKGLENGRRARPPAFNGVAAYGGQGLPGVFRQACNRHTWYGTPYGLKVMAHRHCTVTAQLHHGAFSNFRVPLAASALTTC
ncbi:unnamed protein product [Arctia plantaginis]|uniref:Uncharacterized protein n=1 Tax=Arctia plantaginis TaxID=874455 RepID=A0A8S0YZ57_ARCPL|nr:unnamed protein product [Arctia plantaginis]CAB3247881.1 unnamed protein product [Arctia plantaginis]